MVGLLTDFGLDLAREGRRIANSRLPKKMTSDSSSSRSGVSDSDVAAYAPLLVVLGVALGDRHPSDLLDQLLE
jgi:hypothetical protein